MAAKPITKPMKIKWEDLPREASDMVRTEETSNWERSAFANDKAQFVFNWLEQGAGSMVPHVHDFDQFALVLEGCQLMMANDDEYLINAGEMLFIPAGVWHCGKAHAEGRTMNLDIFCPPREDYLHIHEWQNSDSGDTPGVTYVGEPSDISNVGDTSGVPD